MRLQAALVAIALGSVVADVGDEHRSVLPGKQGCETLKTQEACCQAFDGRDDLETQQCAPAKSSNFGSGQTCEPRCYVDGSKSCKGILADQGFDNKDIIHVCWTTTTTTTTTTTQTGSTTTTSFTPWDSSASSIDSTHLDSSYSSSFKNNPESSASSARSSWQNSGSDASGSGGFYMHFWTWGILGGVLAALCLACCVALMKPKPKKKKKAAPPPPEPEPVEDPMPELAPLMPQNQGMMPMTTSYIQQVPMSYPATNYMQAAPVSYVV